LKIDFTKKRKQTLFGSGSLTNTGYWPVVVSLRE
jgi:hypothetical protein